MMVLTANNLARIKTIKAFNVRNSINNDFSNCTFIDRSTFTATSLPITHIYETLKTLNINMNASLYITTLNNCTILYTIEDVEFNSVYCNYFIPKKRSNVLKRNNYYILNITQLNLLDDFIHSTGAEYAIVLPNYFRMWQNITKRERVIQNYEFMSALRAIFCCSTLFAVDEIDAIIKDFNKYVTETYKLLYLNRCNKKSDCYNMWLGVMNLSLFYNSIDNIEHDKAELLKFKMDRNEKGIIQLLTTTRDMTIINALLNFISVDFNKLVNGDIITNSDYGLMFPLNNVAVYIKCRESNTNSIIIEGMPEFHDDVYHENKIYIPLLPNHNGTYFNTIKEFINNYAFKCWATFTLTSSVPNIYIDYDAHEDALIRTWFYLVSSIPIQTKRVDLITNSLYYYNDNYINTDTYIILNDENLNLKKINFHEMSLLKIFYMLSNIFNHTNKALVIYKLYYKYIESLYPMILNDDILYDYISSCGKQYHYCTIDQFHEFSVYYLGGDRITINRLHSILQNYHKEKTKEI